MVLKKLKSIPALSIFSLYVLYANFEIGELDLLSQEKRILWQWLQWETILMGRIFESCDFDGRILVMTFGKPICGSSRREKEKKPLLPPHKNWLKKVPLLCLKGYKSMKWDFRRAVIDACNYFHACPNSTGCLDIAYTTHAPTTAGATEILLPQIQKSS